MWHAADLLHQGCIGYASLGKLQVRMEVYQAKFLVVLQIVKRTAQPHGVETSEQG